MATPDRDALSRVAFELERNALRNECLLTEERWRLRYAALEGKYQAISAAYATLTRGHGSLSDTEGDIVSKLKSQILLYKKTQVRMDKEAETASETIKEYQHRISECSTQIDREVSLRRKLEDERDILQVKLSNFEDQIRILDGKRPGKASESDLVYTRKYNEEKARSANLRLELSQLKLKLADLEARNSHHEVTIIRDVEALPSLPFPVTLTVEQLQESRELQRIYEQSRRLKQVPVEFVNRIVNATITAINDMRSPTQQTSDYNSASLKHSDIMIPDVNFSSRKGPSSRHNRSRSRSRSRSRDPRSIPSPSSSLNTSQKPHLSQSGTHDYSQTRSRSTSRSRDTNLSKGRSKSRSQSRSRIDSISNLDDIVNDDSDHSGSLPSYLDKSAATNDIHVQYQLKDPNTSGGLRHQYNDLQNNNRHTVECEIASSKGCRCRCHVTSHAEGRKSRVNHLSKSQGANTQVDSIEKEIPDEDWSLLGLNQSKITSVQHNNESTYHVGSSSNSNTIAPENEYHQEADLSLDYLLNASSHSSSQDSFENDRHNAQTIFDQSYATSERNADARTKMGIILEELKAVRESVAKAKGRSVQIKLKK